MASETVDPIDWSHPPPSWAVPPESLVHSTNQCNLSGNRTCNRSMPDNHLAYAATQSMLPILRYYQYCGANNTAVLPILRCYHYCGNTNTAVLSILRCYPYCGATHTAVLPILRGYQYCCATHTAVLPILRCYQYWGATNTAVLPILRCGHWNRTRSLRCNLFMNQKIGTLNSSSPTHLWQFISRLCGD